MKNVFAVLSLCLALSLAACTKKEAATEEGTTAPAATEGAAPAEMQEKPADGAAAPTEAAPAEEKAAH